MPITLVLLLLFVAALGLMGVALSGYGSRDRSHEAPPNLPGHDVIRKKAQRKADEA